MTVEHAELARIAFAYSPHPLPWGELRTWGPHPLDDDRGRHDGAVLPAQDSLPALPRDAAPLADATIYALLTALAPEIGYEIV